MLTSLVLVEGPVADDEGVKAVVKLEVVMDEAGVVLEDEMVEEALVEVVV